MEGFGLRLSRLSPINSALLALGLCVVVFGLVVASELSGEMREGAVIYLVIFSVAVAASVYWGKQREVAGRSKTLFPNQSPAVAGLTAFAFASVVMASFAYFVYPERSALLYGMFLGTFSGVLAYEGRRGAKPPLLRLSVIFIALFLAYRGIDAILTR